MKFTPGQTAYFISSCIFIKKVTIIRVTNSFITIKFNDGTGGTRVRPSKLYETKEEAQKIVNEYLNNNKNGAIHAPKSKN